MSLGNKFKLRTCIFIIHFISYLYLCIDALTHLRIYAFTHLCNGEHICRITTIIQIQIQIGGGRKLHNAYHYIKVFLGHNIFS